MQNYNKPPMKYPVIREIIPTNSNSQENRFFFLTLFVVILLAVILLWATVHKKDQLVRLPNQLNNLATQLSIASDEIAMLQDVGLLNQVPTLSELHENQVEPFMSETILAASENCFVIIKQQVVLRLIKLPELNWQVQWRTVVEQHSHDQDDSKQQLHYTEFCQADNSWLATARTDVAISEGG